MNDKKVNDRLVIAFVPIRHESQRLPGKNYRILRDKPLYHYIISTLINLEEISAVFIDTNSPVIFDGCQKYFKSFLGKKLFVLTRDANLTDHMVSMNVLIDSFFQRRIYEYDLNNCIIFQTHVTNPFLKGSTIKEAIEKYKEALKDKTHDSLFSVSTWRTRFYDHKEQPINHDPNNLIQTQDLSPIYEDNSCIYLFTKESFYKRKNRLGETPGLYPMHDREELVDIDWLADFELAEAYLERRQARTNKKEPPKATRTVLITGVSGGIGSVTAALFKKEGYYVYGTDLREISEQEKLYDKFIIADLCSENAVSEIFKEISKEQTKLDVLINIAAMQTCATFENITLDSWDQLMACNLKSPYFLIQAFLPLLKEAKGCVVNVSSIHSVQTSSDISSYAISKAGLSGLTRSLAVELGRFGIRVNAVSPGAIDTPMLKDGLQRSAINRYLDDVKEGETIDTIDNEIKKLAEKHIMGFIGRPKDVANAIVFLADNEKARFITGTNLVVDGGATVKLSTE